MTKNRVGSLIIQENGILKGILTEKDIQEGMMGKKFNEDFITKKIFCPDCERAQHSRPGPNRADHRAREKHRHLY